MGKVAKTVGAVLSVAGIVVGAATGFGAVATALFIGGSVLGTIGQLSSKPSLSLKGDILQSLKNNGHLVPTRSTGAEIPVVYGTCRIAGNMIYASTAGENNKYLYMAYSLCEGPISDVLNIYLNGTPLNQTRVAAFVTWDHSLGGETNSRPTWFPAEFSDNLPWLATLYVKLTYQTDKWQRVPDITALVKGRVIYDPRNGTWGAYDNPALVLYDFLTNHRYGWGIDPSEIDIDSFKAAADYCDNKGLKFNGYLKGENRFDLLLNILDHFRGVLDTSSGKISLKIQDLYYEGAAAYISNKDIVAASFGFDSGNIDERINTVKVLYPDPNLNYQTSTVTIEDKEAISTEPRREREIYLYGASRTHAARIGRYVLKRARLNSKLALTVHPKFLYLDVGDVVKVSYTDFGISEELYRIVGMTLNQDDSISLELIKEDFVLYDDSVSSVDDYYPDTDLPDPLAEPPTVGGLTLSESIEYDNGVWKFYIDISFTEPDSGLISHYDVFLSDGEKTELLYRIDYAAAGNTVNLRTPPLTLDKTYTIKVQTISIYDVKSAFAEKSYTLQSKAEYPPSDVTNLTTKIEDGRLVLSWDASSDPVYGFEGVKGYKIKAGSPSATWETATEITFVDTTSWEFHIDWVGEKKFFIKAVDIHGYESKNPTSASVIVDPPNPVNNLSASAIDTSVLLRWDEPNPSTLPITGYIIKKGDDWNTATEIGTIDGTFKVIHEKTSGTYTYWVAAKDSAGNISTPKSVSIKVDQPPDYVLHTIWNDDFSGTKNNCVLTSVGLLCPVPPNRIMDVHWDNYGGTPQLKIDAGYPIFAQPGSTTGYYEQTFDYGAVLAGTKVTVAYNKLPVEESVDVSVDISYSEDGSTWNTITNTESVFATNFRYVKIKLNFSGSSDKALALITNLTVTLATKKKMDSGKVTANSADANGTWVGFNIDFVDVITIAANVILDTNESADNYNAVIAFDDVPYPTGFYVYVFDKNGNRVTKDVYWTAIGV